MITNCFAFAAHSIATASFSCFLLAVGYFYIPCCFAIYSGFGSFLAISIFRKFINE
jgi:hypothetical protein